MGSGGVLVIQLATELPCLHQGLHGFESRLGGACEWPASCAHWDNAQSHESGTEYVRQLRYDTYMGKLT